ncbi:unnamed protein product [Rotaria socialis]|uniref:Thioredoxin domain-containing protein n=1 Tax=Rotaria socialis TaxID=392032 RepID=A0A820PW15_9BILA|nr:unnamed protein product [Rotaria socialis]CAF3455698.1 unnamed protein product [Rotaria socialis]CAF3639740.1 unnamed protein product [Rotaria socialis]CAF4141120.1 unnamed protein product [Rotaria socialis]CAF4294708.1 unnamed protein product [Rotaria socialis]
MPEFESDALLLHAINSQAQTKIQRAEIFLQLLSNGHIHVDWSDLPKHRNSRQCVIHYKSLNTNRSHSLCVSRKMKDAVIEKVQAGHLYDIHVCTVDELNRVLYSTEHAQIQTVASNEAPMLRVAKSTPDFIVLEWEQSKLVKLLDIEMYKLRINGAAKVLLPPTENKFIINDGQFGKRYIFELEMYRKDGKTISSIPVMIKWPGVTLPKREAFINGSKELIISWKNPTSIHDGNVESYTVYIYDSEKKLLSEIGPNPPECRQVWIEDLPKGVYFHVLEMKLADSKKSILSKPMRIECGNESTRPILTCSYTDANQEKQLIDMAYLVANLRDNAETKRLSERCENQLMKILSTLTYLTDSIHVNLNIELKSNDNIPKSYHLIVDGKESSASIPGTIRNLPFELPRRDKPYELAVLLTPALYGTKSKTILVEASHHFSFFCAHFSQQRSTRSCSYLETLPYEKQQPRPVHQGVMKPSKMMTEIQVYDFNKNEILSLPSLGQSNRFSIILFYVAQCIPSRVHLNYLSKYASTYSSQYNFISINCNQNDIDGLKELTENFTNVQCYTDFSSEDFEYERKNNETPVHEILSIAGVPLYFILNFSGHVVWRGRLCTPDQEKYDAAMDHIIAEVSQMPCSPETCDLCSIDDSHIETQLTNVDKNLQFILLQRMKPYENKNREVEPLNRIRRTVSMNQQSIRINDN